MAVTQRVLIATLAILLAACGGTAKPQNPTADPLAGRYSASGGGGALAAVTALTKRFAELHGRGERSATGWKQVLDAASDARVDTLLVEEGAEARAWECPQCGRASADGGSCPLDGTKLEERDDAADLAMHQTLANGGGIVTVGSGALGDAKGIAALLRF